MIFIIISRWEGEGVDEFGLEVGTSIIRVRVDPKYYRPTEVDILLGDASKAKRLLGWVPTTDFESLVSEMVLSDIESVKKNRNDRS